MEHRRVASVAGMSVAPRAKPQKLSPLRPLNRASVDQRRVAAPRRDHLTTRFVVPQRWCELDEIGGRGKTPERRTNEGGREKSNEVDRWVQPPRNGSKGSDRRCGTACGQASVDDEGRKPESEGEGEGKPALNPRALSRPKQRGDAALAVAVEEGPHAPTGVLRRKRRGPQTCRERRRHVCGLENNRNIRK